jgi:alkyl hydroperoxide reductase subunit AhpC
MSSSTTIERDSQRQRFALILTLSGLLILPTKSPKSETLEQPTPLNLAAPEFVGGPWLNTPGDEPISLASRRGKVTIVHFWTYGCYNCQNNLAAYARWHKRFASRDVTIVGVHTPETSSERVSSNVIKHVKEFKIEYPVLFDQSETNWRRWQQRYWPTVYLIDRNGKVRFRWIGELNYGGKQGEAKMVQLVEDLLKEPI